MERGVQCTERVAESAKSVGRTEQVSSALNGLTEQGKRERGAIEDNER